MNSLISENTPADFHCGYITIIGRPNVGKSTLLNQLMDKKISITSRKPQTTRWHLLGIKTEENYQAVYIDTPGIQTKYKNALNRHMTREAVDTIAHVDVVIFMIEAMKWTDSDKYAASFLNGRDGPTLIVINKIDKIKEKNKLLPFIEELAGEIKYEGIVPLAAKTGLNVKLLENKVISILPAHPAIFPVEQISDRNERFFAAEFVREKLIKKLGDELPYHITVTIEKFIEKKDINSVHAIIWIGSQSQKSIVIGKNGAVLKSVGELARKDMEKFFNKKIYLKTWVKIKKKWTEDEGALKQLGY